MSGGWSGGGAAALRRHAPTVGAALAGLATLRPRSVTEAELAAIRAVTAEGLGLAPLPPPAGAEADLRGVPVEVMAFAEQMAVDVTALDDDQRGAWLRATAGATLEATLVAWISDFVPRVRATLDALFGADAWVDPPPTATAHAQAIADELVREIALLDVVDPVTTELVRLRVARQHRCRVDMARRSLAAIEAGAGVATFATLDHYRSSTLPGRQQAALALADAMVWTPAHLRARDLDAVRRHLVPAEAVEVVLDVLACSAHKTAVALTLDAAEDDDVQVFEVDDDGYLTFP